MNAHVRAWLAAVGGLPTGRLFEHGDVLWARTAMGWPLFNGGTGTSPEGVDTALLDLQRQGRPFLWWGGDPAALHAAGLVALDRDMPWEEAPIASLPAPELPPGVRLEEVRDEAGHRTWARTLREVHGFPRAGERAWVQSGELGGWSRLPWRMWTAFDDNDPVGVTLLFCGGGVASLIGVGVTEDHRRRGIGRGLTLAPLHEADEHVAGLFATADGAHVYRSLGFRLRERMTRWLWTPEPLQFTLRPGASGAARTY